MPDAAVWDVNLPGGARGGLGQERHLDFKMIHLGGSIYTATQDVRTRRACGGAVRRPKPLFVREMGGSRVPRGVSEPTRLVGGG